MKILVGNWKSNGNTSNKRKLFSALRRIKTDVKIILCLPYTLLGGDKNKNIAIAAQNISSFENGAFTGEISGQMIKDTGAKYVLIGHSERRTYHRETNAIVKDKAQLAIKYGLIPIICIGETLAEHKANKTKSVIKKMLLESIPDNGKFIIAYEPRWAIGTGITPTKTEVQQIHQFIFNILHNIDQEKTPILFGGSINAKNATRFITIPHVDGYMVGRASLKPETFLPIIQQMNKIQ